MKQYRFLTDRQLNILRGKTIAGHITKHEILSVFGHADSFEFRLEDIEEENGDMFGTEGWRHFLGLPEDE